MTNFYVQKEANCFKKQQNLSNIIFTTAMLYQMETNMYARESELVRIKQVRRVENRQLYLVQWMDGNGNICQKWESLLNLNNYMPQVAQAKKQAICKGNFHLYSSITQEVTMRNNKNPQAQQIFLQNESFEVQSSQMLTDQTDYQQFDFSGMRLINLQFLSGNSSQLRYSVEIASDEKRIQTYVLSSEVLRRYFFADFVRLLQAKSF